MSEQIDDFRAVIEGWPIQPGERDLQVTHIAAFGDDIGVSFKTAKGMHHRNSIPSGYWARAVAAAARKGFEAVTLSLLARLAEDRRESA